MPTRTKVPPCVPVCMHIFLCVLWKLPGAGFGCLVSSGVLAPDPCCSRCWHLTLHPLSSCWSRLLCTNQHTHTPCGTLVPPVTELRHKVHPVAGPGSLSLLLHSKTHTPKWISVNPWILNSLGQLPWIPCLFSSQLLPLSYFQLQIHIPAFWLLLLLPSLVFAGNHPLLVGTLMPSNCWYHRPLHVHREHRTTYPRK